MAYILGCSVKGEKNNRNQDAWGGVKITNKLLVISVADGLGSADHSHIGSKLATNSVVNILDTRLRGETTISEDEITKIFRNAFGSVRKQLFEKAEELGELGSDLSTTLLVVVLGPNKAAGAAVGDGGIVGYENGDHYSVVDREQTEYANVTVPLTSENWENSFRMRVTTDIDAVALFTDGISNFTWGLENSDQPRTEFFDQIFPFAISTDQPAHANEELCNFLKHSHFKDFTTDDKTLAIGVNTETATKISNSSISQTRK